MPIFAPETRIVPLTSPLHVDGTEVRQLTLRAPSLAAIRAAVAAAPVEPVDQALALISLLSGQPAAALADLGLDDLLTLTDAAEAMIELPVATTIPRAGRRKKRRTK